MIDFPTILYASDRELSTLWFNWCLKGDAFWVDPPCISHYREYPQGSYKSLYFVILSLVECGNCLTYQNSANHINTSTWSSYIVIAIFSCFSLLTGIESESVYPLSFKYIQNILQQEFDGWLPEITIIILINSEVKNVVKGILQLVNSKPPADQIFTKLCCEIDLHKWMLALFGLHQKSFCLFLLFCFVCLFVCFFLFTLRVLCKMKTLNKN